MGFRCDSKQQLLSLMGDINKLSKQVIIVNEVSNYRLKSEYISQVQLNCLYANSLRQSERLAFIR